MRRSISLTLTIATFAITSTVSKAQTNSYISSTDGFWDEARLWSLGVPPSVAQSGILITNVASKTVTIDSITSSLFANTLTISNLTVSAPLGAINTLFLSNAGTNTPLAVLNQLTITGGGILQSTNSAMQLGGDLIINGDSLLQNSNFQVASNAAIRIGDYLAVGTLTMQSGQLLAGAMAVGNSGSGTFEMRGGTNDMIGDLTVGYGGGALINGGSVWLHDGLLRATNGTTRVGYGLYGIGHMTVSNGIVLARSFEIGMNGGISQYTIGTLTVAGGQITMDQLTGGAGGKARIELSGGTLVVTNGDISLGYGRFGDEGIITVSAAGTLLARHIILGWAGGGFGKLEMSNGLAIVNGDLSLAAGDRTSGRLAMTGGQLFVTNGTIFVGGIGQGYMTVSGGVAQARSLSVRSLVQGQGTLSLEGGTVRVDDALTIGDGGPTAGGNVAKVGSGELVATNGPTYVGYSSFGSLVVSGGIFRARDIFLAYAVRDSNPNPPLRPGGTLTVAGGLLTSTGITIGDCLSNFWGDALIADGMVIVINNSHSGCIDVRNGTFTLSGGSLIVDRLVVTNSCGHFIRSGGNLIASAIIIDPALDADGDGLPNGWEQAHGLDPLIPTGHDGPDGDADGDGMTNLQEYLAGTNPTNSASAFRILSITPESDNVRVTWLTCGGRTNAVEAATSMSGIYSNLSSNIIITGSSDTTTNYLDLGAVTNWPAHFYRVRLVQ